MIETMNTSRRGVNRKGKKQKKKKKEKGVVWNQMHSFVSLLYRVKKTSESECKFRFTLKQNTCQPVGAEGH